VTRGSKEQAGLEDEEAPDDPLLRGGMVSVKIIYVMFKRSYHCLNHRRRMLRPWIADVANNILTPIDDEIARTGEQS